jgi:5-methyltetrahydrofolate--homocysteine methyltransferase
MRPYIAELARASPTRYVSCYPNAGLPNAFGEYDETPGRWRGCSRVRRERLVNIVGGCCGTTPEHIARSPTRCAAAAAPARRSSRAAAVRPRAVQHRPTIQLRQCRRAHQRHRLGESSRKLILAGDYAARSRSRASRSRRRAIIDVNMDEGMLDSEQAMTTFLNLIAAEPDIARVPVMIDSSKWS